MSPIFGRGPPGDVRTGHVNECFASVGAAIQPSRRLSQQSHPAIALGRPKWGIPAKMMMHRRVGGMVHPITFALSFRTPAV